MFFPTQPISRLLTTPLEILDEAWMLFPTSRLTKVQDVPLHLDLSLGYTIPPLRITSCLDQFRFLFDLQRIAIAQIKADYAGVPFVPQPLDASRFSIASPLSNWLRFQRIMYNRDNKKCEDVIKTYLATASAASIPDPNLDQLRTLGFAPDQVEGHLTNDTLSYFKLAIEGLPLNDARVQNLRKVYPNTTRQLAIAIEAEKLIKPVNDSYESILEQLQSRVIGQECATAELASTLAKTVPNENSVFLFVGPTGIGKTELAKSAATLKNDRMIAFHMNQFTDAHSVSTLFGSPAGYVGSTDKPQLAKEFERHKAALTRIDNNNITITGIVILFDEFEKAHPELKQSLLTLFDEGHCTVRYTERNSNISIKYTLKDCIIINTSNLCQDVILNAFQKNYTTELIIGAFKASNKVLQQNPYAKSYSDELIGRMQVIPFGPIPRGLQYQNLLGMKLDRFLPRMQKEIGCKDIEVENRPQVLQLLETRLYGEGIDIRRIDNYYKSLEKTAIAQKGKWGDIKRVKITLYSNPPNSKAAGALNMKASLFSELVATYIPLSDINSYQEIEEEEKKE